MLEIITVKSKAKETTKYQRLSPQSSTLEPLCHHMSN